MRKHIVRTLLCAQLAVIGAARVAVWACDLMARALTRWGGWQAAEAAKAVPWVVFSIAAGLALSLWDLHEDNKRYSRSGYGRVVGYGARQKSRTDDEERGA